MTPKNVEEPPGEDDTLGVLDDTASLDTAAIGILGRTAQVSVELPKDEDDDLVDDSIVDGEVVADLIMDDPGALAPAPVGRFTEGEIVIELPAESADAVAATTPAEDAQDAGEPGDSADAGEAEVDVESDARVEADAAVDESSEPTESAEGAHERAAAGSDVAAAEREPAVDEHGAADARKAAEERQAAEERRAAEERKAAQERRAAEERQAAEERRAAEERKAAEEREAAQRAAAAFVERARADALKEAARAAAESALSSAAAPATASVTQTAGAPAPTQAGAIAPARKETAVDSRGDKKSPARAARTEKTLTSKRLDDLSETSRESADLLTADRLLDPHRITKPEPEGAWSHFLYTISGRRINIGDGRKARERKALSARIAAPLNGGARFVPVLSRKGGVGKTTITALLGMALADAREDRVIAVDANPDRGTLADRIVRSAHSRSVRDLVRIHDAVKGYHDISAVVARDATRLDVLASDPDPRIAEAFSDSDYRDVADVAAHYYSLVLTDTGTGIVHSVMSATLDLADQIVIVSGLSVDEARLASETLTWLETNGYAEQAAEAIVVLNQSTPGAPLVRLNELEAHFATRARHVVRMPYDPQIAAGGAIVFANLQPETRVAARELAALLVEGLRAKAA